MPSDPTLSALLVYGVASVETGKSLELFARLADAERFIEDVRRDDAELPVGQRKTLPCPVPK